MGVLLGFLSLALVACTSRSSPELDVLATLVAGDGVGVPAIPDNPDPRFRYLRVELRGNPPGLLVLGYVDQHPLGPIEVWYSALKEVIKIQNGRIVGTAGLKEDWSSVRFAQVPAQWEQITAQGMRFERQRDAMPGYRYGISEQMQVSRTEAMPSIGLMPSLSLATAQRYQWFHETSTSTNGGLPGLPDAWFAWGKHRGQYDVVYSEQCLAPDFCLRLQRWPVTEEVR